jgi:hypothetical protein
MRLSPSSACLAVGLFFAIPAQAQFQSGNELLEMMVDEKATKKMQGLGYIQGVVDAINGTVACPPRVSTGQVIDMVKLFLEGNPAVRHLGAANIVAYVLKENWPCKSV